MVEHVRSDASSMLTAMPRDERRLTIMLALSPEARQGLRAASAKGSPRARQLLWWADVSRTLGLRRPPGLAAWRVAAVVAPAVRPRERRPRRRARASARGPDDPEPGPEHELIFAEGAA